jgi:hypothetical protein
MDVEFSKDSQISNFMENLPVGASCSTRTDGWTDRNDEANSRFSQFCERAYQTLLPSAALSCRHHSDAAVPKCED